MPICEFKIKTLSETVRLGKLLGRYVERGDVICLDGDLGAGKTTLTQAIGRGLNLPDEIYVSSPSFALLHEYPGGRLPLYHMDLYRLSDSQDVIENGLDEYFYGQGVTVVEWAARATDVLPESHLDIFISMCKDLTRCFRCICDDAWRHRLHLIESEME